jgi:protein TonB
MKAVLGALLGILACGCVGAPPGSHPAPGELFPLIRFSPVYPEEAQRRELEGWVRVRYDVSPDGKVLNVVVEESSDPVFEQASIDAAYKFVYPPLGPGEPAESRTATNLFRYTIDPPEPRGC